VNGPAGTISAATIVVFGSDSVFRLSHDAGDEASVADSARTAIMCYLQRSTEGGHSCPPKGGHYVRGHYVPADTTYEN
jgi:hypothetical protein